MSRPLTPGEARLARGVFGEGVDYARVRIGGGGLGRMAVTIGSRIFFPAPVPADFAHGGVALQAWFVHEMTHVLQFQSAPLRTLWSWLLTLLSGGYSAGRGYRYALPLRDWDDYNLEQQASIVEHAFLLWRGAPCPNAPKGASLAVYEGYGPFASEV